jgi:hypothetical protein
MIPGLSIIVGYSCPNCRNDGIRRKDESCCKCGTVFNWSPYKSGKLPSSYTVKRILLNTQFKEIRTENGGRASYHNKLSLSVRKRPLPKKLQQFLNPMDDIPY